MKFLELKIKDKFGIIKTLVYKLYETPLVEKWIKITEENLSLDNHTISSAFINRTIEDVPELLSSINNLLSNINHNYDRPIEIFDQVGTKELNYLHEQFEEFGKRIDELHQTGKYNTEVANWFFSLNEHIHACESALETTGNEWGGFGVLYDLYPVGIHADLSEEDLLFLEPHHSWGKLYLGYNTLGKDWMAVYRDNDLEVIERHMVKPQQRFAAEAWLHFGPDQLHYNQVTKFIKWAKTLPDNLQKQIPFNNLNELRLGRYAIGEVVIDSEFLKIDSNPDNWKTFRHKSKMAWNYEVFTTYRSIESVKIINFSKNQ